MSYIYYRGYIGTWKDSLTPCSGMDLAEFPTGLPGSQRVHRFRYGEKLWEDLVSAYHRKIAKD